MKTLLTLSTLIELGAGLALLGLPSAAAVLLLGSALDTPAALTVARLGGAALLTLAAACWFARHDAQSCAARGLTGSMVIYNLGAVVVLGVAGIQLHPIGIALWPAVVLHAAMTVWCIVCLCSGNAEQTARPPAPTAGN